MYKKITDENTKDSGQSII